MAAVDMARPVRVRLAVISVVALMAAGPVCAVDSPEVFTPIAGDGWVVLRWNDATAGLYQVTSYVIYRTTPTGEWTTAGTVYNQPGWNPLAKTMAFWDEGLTNGVEYSYVVRSLAKVDSWADSATIWFTPQAGYAGANGPVEAQSGDKWVRLTWNLSATWWAGEEGITRYRVFRATDPGTLGRFTASSSLHDEIPADTGYIDLVGLTNKITYYYMVFPAYPERTPFIVKAVPFRPIYAGGRPVARIDGSAPRKIRVTWGAAPAPNPAESDALAGYAVFRSDDGGGTMAQIFSVPTTTFSVLDEVPVYGKRYVYMIRPIDSAGRLGDAYPLAIIDVELPSNRLYLNHNRFRPGRGETLTAIFQITEAGRVRISVMSLTGERIKTLYDRDHAGNYSPDAPLHSFYAGLPAPVWDGSNESGRLVGSGAYLVVLEIGKQRYIGSVAVIR